MLAPPKQSFLHNDNSEQLDTSENKHMNVSVDDHLNISGFAPSPSSKTSVHLLKKPYQNNAPSKQFMCFKRRNNNWRDMPNREICPLIPDTSLPTNKIQTSKYTWLTFLPINLVEQFSQLANFYFLLIAVMQTMPSITITNGNPVMVLPLSVILTISAIKSLFEDWKRHKSDNEENDRSVLIYTKESFQQSKWSDIRVGDIIQVNKNEPLPVDIILLYSKDPKGKCYVETKNLDGETNLKTKFAPKEISKHFINVANISETPSYCSFVFDKPSPYLYQFKGTATISNTKVSLDYSNFLLRGSSLRTTEYIYGLVVYTGHETKIMLNSVKAQPKHSRVEQILSKMVILIFIAQLVVCTFTSLYYRIILDHKMRSLTYLGFNLQSAPFFLDVVTRLGNWILIFTNFVPISMMVTLELIRFAQSFQVSEDSKMKTDTIAPVVQSSVLNEELGQIQYIFSDKTGTLTSNQMVFKKLSVNGIIYGDSGHATLQQDELFNKNQDVTNVDFVDKKFFKILGDPAEKEHESLKNMILAQAICHTVIVEHEENSTSFSGSSADELALVNFAKLCGYVYKGTDEKNVMIIETPQKEHRFQILNIFEFDSDRKRMSVVVRDETNQIFLFCKGADSVILERASKNTSTKAIDSVNNNLISFASEGLRTLVYSMKKLDTKEYNQWMIKYKIAITSMVDREKMMQGLQDELEGDLELLGATGIEDLLQDRVGDTIEFILDAEIKLWVLTGDKVETAQSIGKSCGLIRPDMKEFLLRAENDQELDNLLTHSLQVMRSHNDELRFYIIITGEALLLMANSHRYKELYQKFTELALEARTVLACRVSPKQKQEIVELVRKAKPSTVTLAIGDGANDVNMITAAQVGVGIRGKEGLQAARASDYSIGEFKHLKRLLFVHGREFYRKNTHVLFYNFYKNMILVLPQFWYGFLDMFSGQSLYDPLMYQFYNLAYGSLPIIIYALFDHEYKDDIFETYPRLYDLGRKNKIFRYSTFGKWVVSGSIQAIFLSIFSFYITQNVIIDDHGLTAGFWLAGGMTLGLVVLNTNIKILLFSYSHSTLSVVIIIGSIIVYYLTLLVLDGIKSSTMFGVLTMSGTSMYYWAGTFIILVITNGTDMAIGRYIYLNDEQASKINALEKLNAHNSIAESFVQPNHKQSSFLSSKEESFLQVSL